MVCLYYGEIIYLIKRSPNLERGVLMKKKLYTAVGILHTRRGLGTNEYPIVTINGKEHSLDLSEMTLWALLNWRILSAEETEKLFKSRQKEFGIENSDSFNYYLERLVKRDLVAEGVGETEADALYDLLSGLYIVPITQNVLLRVVSFVKLTLINKVPYSVTRKIFGKDNRTEDEKKVIRLANQSTLSTAEIIKCVESGRISFSSEEQIMDTIYHDEFTTCDNISEVCRNLKSCRPILTSVANLLLRRQIILERL